MKTLIYSLLLMLMILVGCTVTAKGPKPKDVMTAEEHSQFISIRAEQEKALYQGELLVKQANSLITSMCADRGIPVAECQFNIGSRAIGRAQRQAPPSAGGK